MDKAHFLQEVIELSWQVQLAIEESRLDDAVAILNDIRKLAQDGIG